MRASLVIPTHRGAERLPRLLSSLEHQTHPDWEAIVVIDGAVDDSAEVVDQFGHLPVRRIVLPTNQGRVAALNTGFAAATGEVLVRVDDDFELAPEHVAAHVEPHRRRVCGVVGLVYNVGLDNRYMRVYGAPADQRARREALATPASQRWQLWGGNVSCTREVYERVGGYDRRYQGYGWEDLDFGYRLHHLGLPIDIAPAAMVRHHLASINTSIRAARAWHSGQARARFESIHGGGSSGAAAPGGSGWWARTVRASAAHLNPGRLAAATTALDRALPLLPAPVGRKAVALLVESASVAGFRRASRQTQDTDREDA